MENSSYTIIIPLIEYKKHKLPGIKKSSEHCAVHYVFCICEFSTLILVPLFTNCCMEFHMTTSVIGLFENGDVASKVVGDLTKSGIEQDAIDILEDVAAS